MIRRVLIFSFLVCLFAACTNAPVNSNTASINTAPAPSPTASPVQSTQSSAQITLPLLDALLADEKFVGQLRSNLKLTNDQIDALKQASHEEIAHLRETNAEDVDTNSGDARARASQKLNSILGDAKARELASFANDYWSKGDQSDASADKAAGPQMLKGPNAVPTDTRVVVNIPAFRMDLFQDGSLVKSYKVGIGYPEFPLPQGLRKASTIILNPTWTPPDSPWVATMKNVTPGETVEAGSKLNPLGPIKIPIGLPSLIHGGKSPARIGKFASHGCVGLTTPQVKDFALMLSKASNTDLSDQTLNSYLQEKDKTKTVKLSQPVPVELRYETIVVEDGKLHIYKDVYGQDTNTEENLRSVLTANGVRFEDLSEQQRTEALDALNAMSTHPQPAASPSAEASPAKRTAKTKKPAKPQNEVVIDLGTVAQKGYPAPVNLDDGSGKTLPQKGTKKNTNH
jgi:lipoprotein-anchoring transpeptidase ErfK/SrfK